MLSLSWLPAVNACLNTTSALLLTAGFWFIRQKNIEAHKRCMLGAFSCSVLFLTGYLTYHWFHGTTRFPVAGTARAIYLTILGTHTVLALFVAPMAIRTLYLGLKNRVEPHRKIARWTLPIWLYVSVTGVVVYWMLYQMNWK
jgi:putative membrane protein